MRLRIVFVLLAAGLFTAADKIHAQGARKKTLTGAWTIVTFERGGQKNAGASDGAVTFSHDQVVVKGKNADHEGTYKIDTAENPKHFDFTPSDGDHAGQLHKGIYEITGGRLKILLAPPDQERPKDFTDRRKEGWLYVELKRKKD